MRLPGLQTSSRCVPAVFLMNGCVPELQLPVTRCDFTSKEAGGRSAAAAAVEFLSLDLHLSAGFLQHRPAGMEPAGAYGAGKAGSVAFDPVAFFTHPRTIVRLLSWVFSIVVFSCIVNEGYINIGSERLLCVFNNNADACNYGVTVGVACFLCTICFLILDLYFPSISSVRDRKRAVLLDLIFSGLACFLWVVGFCFLANQWQATSADELPLAQGSDAARATIAFCFFSILTWAVLTLSALRRFLSGSNMTMFTWQHLDTVPGNARATPYPITNGATIVTTNPYQAPPFTETLDPQKLTQQRPMAPAF